MPAIGELSDPARLATQSLPVDERSTAGSRATMGPLARLSPTPVAGGSTARDPSEEPSAFARLLRGVAHEADRGEATLKGALGASSSGGALDPTHLLALQAGIYRYAETVDLATQLVDKACTAVKTVVQGQ